MVGLTRVSIGPPISVIDRGASRGRSAAIKATAAERAALATRFALVRIDRLEAEVNLAVEGDTVDATGRLRAAFVQSCAVSGEDLAVAIDEPIALRFVPETEATEEEVELEASELDQIPYSGTAFDLGEACFAVVDDAGRLAQAVAQALALGLDFGHALLEALRALAGLIEVAA